MFSTCVSHSVRSICRTDVRVKILCPLKALTKAEQTTQIVDQIFSQDVRQGFGRDIAINSMYSTTQA